eukprot:m.82390 g.82390  ORF g.82390 m.82390 type:complete len:285 (-) comp12084_c0_seq9:266-1120(-)
MMKSFFFPVLATVLVLLTSQSMVGLVDAQIISSESVDYRLGFIIAAALAIVFFVMTVLMAVYINKTISRQKKIERRQLELTAESNRRNETSPFSGDRSMFSQHRARSMHSAWDETVSAFDDLQDDDEDNKPKPDFTDEMDKIIDNFGEEKRIPLTVTKESPEMSAVDFDFDAQTPTRTPRQSSLIRRNDDAIPRMVDREEMDDDEFTNCSTQASSDSEHFYNMTQAMKEHKKSEPPLDTDGELSSFDNPAHNLNVLQDFDNQSRSSRTNTVSFPTEIREQDNEV